MLTVGALLLFICLFLCYFVFIVIVFIVIIPTSASPFENLHHIGEHQFLHRGARISKLPAAQQWHTQEFFSGGVQQIQLSTEGR
jgi:predicted PurR-regulated permease PerM